MLSVIEGIAAGDGRSIWTGDRRPKTGDGKNLVIPRDDFKAPPKYNERGAISLEVGWVDPIKDHE